MALKVQIDLNTNKQRHRNTAHTIATTAANGLRSVQFVGEGGGVLEVVAASIDAAGVVENIRGNAGLKGAKLICVVQQS
ncbi:hypothetical protein EUGRSUZ_E03826 [Eucalyptus grandis]|uniref:Uncharacterized protein n=2 Tax=Eucalyptus grandis TaxID=71139 RepID=A0ACC3L123_EUCGR|nr:hypothetical protein EUGRSUZ_E03826 [Eucalyptus grandis]